MDYTQIKKPDTKEIPVGHFHYVKEYRMLFIKYEWGLEPQMIDCDEYIDEDGVSYKGIEIEADINNVYFLLILYIRRCSERFSPKDGSPLMGFLEVHQWNVAIEVVKNVFSLGSKDSLLAASRQSGKSALARFLLPFITIFAKKFTFVKEGRFFSAWVSPTSKLGEDHYKKLKGYFKGAVDLFNEIYPDMPLVGKQEDKEVESNKNTLVYDMMSLNGTRIPYCQFVLMSADPRSKNAGFTLHCLFVDESQMINADFFNEQIQPTTMRTGGCVVSLGTTLPDPSNLLYFVFRKKTIPRNRKFLINVIEAYTSICLRSYDEANDYWNRFEQELANHGMYSDYVQSQYFVSFEIKGERWFTIEALEEKNIFNIPRLGIHNFTETLPSYSLNSTTYYRVGSFDSAKLNDFAALTIGIIERKITDDDETYHSYITDYIIVNDEEITAKTILDPEQMIQKVSVLCKRYQLDMIVFEASGQQDDRAFYLAKELKSRKLGCKVMPLSYGGRNKEKIFLKVENEIAAGRLSLPILDNVKISKEYREFIEELKIFRKVFSGSSIKFSAPDGKGLHDDFISSMANFIYLPHLINDAMSKGTSAGLGISADYDYPLGFWYKNTNTTNSSNRTVFAYK